MKIYLVGGAIRDKLLGYPIKERDYVIVGTTSEELIAQGFTSVGKDFPVFLHPETKEEYALARTERKTKPGYKGFQVYASPEITLEEDLQRRDLTINAIAQDENGTLIDPFGGQRDLKNKILRHISLAFVEDPVRILRIARFAARFNFSIASETLDLMRQMVTNREVDHLTPERVWKELERALQEKYPQNFFKTLRACDALAKIFPEIESLFHIPIERNTSTEDNMGEYTLSLLKAAAILALDTQIQFGLLVHAFGKSNLYAKSAANREELLISTFCNRLRIPNIYQEFAVLVARYYPQLNQSQRLSAKELLILLQNLDAFRRSDRFEKFLLVCKTIYEKQKNNYCCNTQILKPAYQAAVKVNIQQIIADGFKGKAIGEQLYCRRINAIDQLKLQDITNQI
ncbi:multifunctional CCA addition/repair protein [Candidatus Nitrosacidococcus tergens]|uniref:CCA-adding enzyme n=1 Tax=Candidatus Nitrosacidococcus tergens TaxID=553981 RepID=A0A7G1QBD2_9GAMM|nr:multifunctional CCA addition/repair protein [Candidatus Nitrosacidococcus tergens]CAB1277336.1 Multifunctional CCA protein [Includes: CCA-adding enzyme; 2'-nucleotidase; 2',3'-cyclic phosphodiesterase; Phosphatase] [Candidatus Nitrosacidococcus tergens]